MRFLGPSKKKKNKKCNATKLIYGNVLENQVAQNSEEQSVFHTNFMQNDEPKRDKRSNHMIYVQYKI